GWAIRVQLGDSVMRTTAIAVLACILPLPLSAVAQDWPVRPVTVVVPFVAGGSQDVLGRIIAQRLTETMGKPFVIDNIGGAGGLTGSVRVAKAPPDGYQFLLAGISLAYHQTFYRKPHYNAVNDFAPVGLVTEAPRVLIARKDLPANTLVEFVAYAKTNQSRMQFGSSGIGTPTHIPCVLLTQSMGVNITHIPYRGSAPAMQDLIGGRIDFLCESVSTATVQIAERNVKPIAILAPRRSVVLPTVPTAHEQGLQGVEADAWAAVFSPKGAPEAIVRKLNRALNDMLDSPAIRSRLEELGFEVAPPERRTPEFLAKFLTKEIERWSKPILAAAINCDRLAVSFSSRLSVPASPVKFRYLLSLARRRMPGLGQSRRCHAPNMAAQHPEADPRTGHAPARWLCSEILLRGAHASHERASGLGIKP